MAKLLDIHTHNPQPGVLSPTMAGIHPWDAERGLPMPDLSSCDIIGETGLDYASQVNREAQQELFCRHLDLAQQLRKPVVLHMVKSFEQTMKILQNYNLKGIVFHGFIGSAQQAQRALAKGYYLSFGERCNKSPKTIEALKVTPLDRIFVESDESTTPIEQIYALIANLRGVKSEELIEAIENNYNRIFSHDE